MTEDNGDFARTHRRQMAGVKNRCW